MVRGAAHLLLLTVATFRIDLAYDGAGFHGYAVNPGVRTVQGVLLEALRKVVGTEPVTVVAGRTDSGVHARNNVVSFGGPDDLDTGRLQRSINSMLGPEVVALDVSVAAPGFDARRWAAWRAYRYRILDCPVADPSTRRNTWHVPGPLDESAMERAAGQFVGEHDFASFCRAAAARTTYRTVLEATWMREHDVLVFDVRATAFCHQMVRSMVAVCAEVGRGRLDAASVPAILAAKDRNAARGAAPAHGLTLWQVGYEA